MYVLLIIREAVHLYNHGYYSHATILQLFFLLILYKEVRTEKEDAYPAATAALQPMTPHRL